MENTFSYPNCPQSDHSIRIPDRFNSGKNKYCLSLKKFSEETYRIIREEANEWCIKEIYEEKWDQFIYGYQRKDVRKESISDISDNAIIVKDGHFDGVIMIEYTNCDFVFKTASIHEAFSSDVYICQDYERGSSDADMMHLESFDAQFRVVHKTVKIGSVFS